MREHEFWVFENVTEEMQKMNGFEQKTINGFESKWNRFESLRVILTQKALSQNGFESVKNGFESHRVF